MSKEGYSNIDRRIRNELDREIHFRLHPSSNYLFNFGVASVIEGANHVVDKKDKKFFGACVRASSDLLGEVAPITASGEFIKGADATDVDAKANWAKEIVRRARMSGAINIEEILHGATDVENDTVFTIVQELDKRAKEYEVFAKERDKRKAKIRETVANVLAHTSKPTMLAGTTLLLSGDTIGKRVAGGAITTGGIIAELVRPPSKYDKKKK